MRPRLTASPRSAPGSPKRWNRAWATAQALLPQRQLADLLGERHRIIVNDWHAAYLNSLIAQLLRRARDVLEQVDLTPAALRPDLAGTRSAASYLFSASELIDHATDLITNSASLVRDNEPRWRIFHDRVATLRDQEHRTTTAPNNTTVSTKS